METTVRTILGGRESGPGVYEVKQKLVNLAQTLYRASEGTYEKDSR